MWLYDCIFPPVLHGGFKLSASLLEPITDKRITSSIAAAGESLVLIMSCVLSVSIMFFILIAIMISAGKFVIGG